jgi:hypothetical protein
MKVGDRYYTRDGADFFYANQIIEITDIVGDEVSYSYLGTNSSFFRDLRDFVIKLEFYKIEKVSPVTELFYEKKK